MRKCNQHESPNRHSLVELPVNDTITNSKLRFRRTPAFKSNIRLEIYLRIQWHYVLRSDKNRD